MAEKSSGVKKSKVSVYLNINDTKNIVKDYSNTGSWGSGNTQLTITSLAEIDYIMELINQLYEKQKK
jgi:predicted transport protein